MLAADLTEDVRALLHASRPRDVAGQNTNIRLVLGVAVAILRRWALMCPGMVNLAPLDQDRVTNAPIDPHGLLRM